MRVLALDSSTDWLSVAASDGARTWERSERTGHAASQRVLGFVDAVLAEVGWSLQQLDGIAFGAGPGSFTGVRIACGVAQGLALGADLPVCGIATLEAIAQSARRAFGDCAVVACLDARMHEVYFAAYRWQETHWDVVHPPEVRKPDEIELLVDATQFAGAGEGFRAYPQLAQRLALRVVRPELVPDARSIAELALPRLAAGQCVTAAEAHPLYVRHRVALTSAERDSGARL
ncbi:MAG TPA: tRNA (adenosine(37)-N6)-threonylcarbamoyltransferase complex dimerization subunit type 1 TsaB [Casimicrobiaceae bacterium]|nr:tRNA (adenosine(37)-N6)-threonylcarbamoyltransferase complex dimerization subunit type 1 TsaB [Casimicrobiaceae bacterium]